MNIAPGWYGVAGTSDVRWWDGAKFRTVLLRDGAVVYEKWRSQTPSLSYVMGAMMFVLGVARLGARSFDNFDIVLAIMFFVVGIVSIVSAVLGQRIEKLPAPIVAPYADPRTMPWPGHVEAGPIAPGWYAAPSAKMPRWWTGARWGEHLILRQFPMPVAGQRRRLVASMWISTVAFGVLALLGLGLVVVGAREGVDAMVVVGSIVMAIFAVATIALALYGARLVRVYTMPSVPPGYRA